MGKIYKGWELIKAIADGEIKDGSRFRNLYQSSKDDFNLYKYENKNLKGRFGGTNLIALLNDKFELIEDEIDIDNIKELKGIVEYATEQDTINKLIQAVKQIDKRVKELEGK